MDAAEEPTRTYLRRVPRRYACKRPTATEAFASNWQTSCAALVDAWRRIRERDTPQVRPCRLGGGIHAATRSRTRIRHRAPTFCGY
ncbi:hypothetical protein E1J24_01255 [Xanthomonas hortorum pv. pelargonii]|uniref:Uncharacterized protein n=1 Tax=Xanthomonas hortorum pv. pelargonii TaxID=453602 RepID=A0AAW9ZMS4_9XANT|nr:hypothetical protein [Xanthomonas hortorum pv. pelargonii]